MSQVSVEFIDLGNGRIVGSYVMDEMRFNSLQIMELSTGLFWQLLCGVAKEREKNPNERAMTEFRVRVSVFR